LHNGGALHAIQTGVAAADDCEGAYVGPSAVLIGDVRIGQRASVWFVAVLRGDNEPIIIGSSCNVQGQLRTLCRPMISLELEENVSALGQCRRTSRS